VKDVIGITALHLAASRCYSDVVMALLEGGAIIDVLTKYGTPLHYAVIHVETVETVVTLLENGANIEALTNFHETVLHKAAGLGKLQVVALLLDRGVNIEAKNLWAETALHLAVRHRHENITLALLYRGANANERNVWEETPLHLASQTNVVRALIERGADTEARDNECRTPLHRAAQFGESELVTALLDGNAAVDGRNMFIEKLLLLQSAPRWATELKAWQGKMAENHKRHVSEHTALHVALAHGKEDTALVLIQRGADIEVINREGETPLDVARKRGFQNIVLTLSSRLSRPALS
jgi:ankyrin repeat protein